MFVEKLTKAELKEASRFNPEDWEGEYVKIVTYFTPRCQRASEINFYRLDKYDPAHSWSHYYRYYGIEITRLNELRTQAVFTLECDNYAQPEIIPITREEFIKECLSLVSDNLKDLINWDKI